jgi:hypothetical protein
MYQLATAPRGIGQVLDSIIQLTRTSFLRMLPYAILTTLISALPFVYLIYTGVLNNPALAAQVVFSGGYWLTILIMIPVSTLLYGASILRIESIAQGADIGIGASFRAALPRILALIGGTIGFMLAIGVGFVLLVIPGVYLLGSLFLFVPAVVLDGKGPIESLNHSHKLVKGNWWRLATIGGIAVIIFYLVYLVAAVVVGFIMGFRGADPAFVFMVDMVSTLVGGLLMMPFLSALYVEMYREVKMRKLGGDLAARIESVGTAR